jgi:Raf kinase inhibitor-like YbhB/YbcL family protein
MTHFKLHSNAATAVDYTQLKISSSAFANEGMIPAKYTCEGLNINPPLDIEHIPEAAKCLALIIDDADAPNGTWVHWAVWNIPVTHHLKENEIHGIQGVNDFKQKNYGGPCPPSGKHRYFFKIYALNALLDLPGTTNKSQLEIAMSEHIIAFGELTGWYQKTYPT